MYEAAAGAVHSYTPTRTYTTGVQGNSAESHPEVTYTVSPCTKWLLTRPGQAPSGVAAAAVQRFEWCEAQSATCMVVGDAQSSERGCVDVLYYIIFITVVACTVYCDWNPFAWVYKLHVQALRGAIVLPRVDLHDLQMRSSSRSRGTHT